MWKDYSIGFIKKNRASSISIMVAAFISSLFLSFLCTMSYYLWVYETEKIAFEEGDWQGRITGTVDEDDLIIIQNFANVANAVINEELSDEHETVVDLYFENARTIFEDMPLITGQLGLGDDASSYHLLLLSRYLIHDPQDESPPLLLIFYLVILLAVCSSLILIIHNSFAVSMNARIHQFGVFSSIGATPGQIRTCLIHEAGVLCAVPVLLGNLLGIAFGYWADLGMEALAANMTERFDIGFQYHPAVFVITTTISAFTVLCSAWLPAMKLSRLTPLEAIRNIGTMELKRRKRSRFLLFLFGIEGELAGNALKAQRRTLRTSTLSLTFSFLGFTMMLCFFSLTDLSTKYTYTQRYQDTWDVMVTIKDTGIEEFGQTQMLEEMKQAAPDNDIIVYQKTKTVVSIPEESISPELNALGGPHALTGTSISQSDSDGTWMVHAPIVILDDHAFLEYCQKTRLTPRLDGTIVLNRIWDSLHSVFRYREYIPFISENQKTMIFQNTGRTGHVEIPVIGFTQEVPVLKEEYDDYALVQFIPLSLWKTISDQIDESEKDTYIRVLAPDEVTLFELNELEQQITKPLLKSYEIISENRIEDQIVNNNIIRGYKMIMGTICFLLAIIGIANVFSYTCGFLTQRRREFAQYMSVGMTPASMQKLFFVEALVIAGRPILITLPMTYLFVEFTARASYLNPKEVWAEIPVATIFLFSLVIVGFVGLAYYLGGRKLLRYHLVDVLRDDTMV